MTSAGRHVVVVGLMGAGKSTVGVALAQRLGVRFVDNDAQLRLITGMTARDLQAGQGREALHRAELLACEAALQEAEPTVVAAAASVVDTEPGRRLLASSHVVWLDVPAASRSQRIVHDHVHDDDHRPPEVATEEEQRRAGWFAEVAEQVVDGDRPTEAIVEELMPWGSGILSR